MCNTVHQPSFTWLCGLWFIHRFIHLAPAVAFRTNGPHHGEPHRAKAQQLDLTQLGNTWHILAHIPSVCERFYMLPLMCFKGSAAAQFASKCLNIFKLVDFLSSINAKTYELNVYSKHVDKVRMVRNRSRPGCIGR
jgi:hypothetical protein